MMRQSKWTAGIGIDHEDRHTTGIAGVPAGGEVALGGVAAPAADEDHAGHGDGGGGVAAYGAAFISTWSVDPRSRSDPCRPRDHRQCVEARFPFDIGLVFGGGERLFTGVGRPACQVISVMYSTPGMFVVGPTLSPHRRSQGASRSSGTAPARGSPFRHAT
jgi:hypothetical protein